jgi:hypothetical protein
MSQSTSLPFQTKDLNQAAFIWCQAGVKLSELVQSGGSVYFKFLLPFEAEGLKKLLIDYSNGDTTVEPTYYADRQSKLRDLLHGSLARNGKKNPKS